MVYPRTVPALLVSLLSLTGSLRAQEPSGLPLERAEAEAFLGSAGIVERTTLAIGVSQSQRVVLTEGALSAEGVWKTIDEYSPVKRFEDGTVEIGFRDSYKSEIAAYELDKLLGLGMVPPTVERSFNGKPGSLQLWVRGATMEFDRLEAGALPADLAERNRQVYKMRQFHNLCFDTDLANARNILSDPDGRLYIIDSSRSFRTKKELPTPGALTRFSRSLLERLRDLDGPVVKSKLGRWLSKKQLEGLLARRDLILEIADRRVAEYGEAVTLFP